MSTPNSFAVGQVVEDVDACSGLRFANNRMTRIITRGLLITTRGKVNIENNDFGKKDFLKNKNCNNIINLQEG